jgi:membrane-associated phospholipid phosphatase
VVSQRRLAVTPLKLIDRLMLGYLAVVSLVAVARLDTRPDAAWVLVANLLTVVLIVLLHRPGLGRVGRTLRDIYPVVLLPALYGALDLLNGFDVQVWDAPVQRLEALLFGGQVSRDWWQHRPSRFWSTVLHATYFSYYFIVPFPALYFLSRREPHHARTAVSMVVATFLVCYVVFLLLPVAGPYYEFPRPDGDFTDNWAARLVYRTLSVGSSYGAAFPSSHVAAMGAATIATWLGSPRLGLALLVPTVLLTIGVVYCQMHYAVDALAGILLPAPIALAIWKVERPRT